MARAVLDAFATPLVAAGVLVVVVVISGVVAPALHAMSVRLGSVTLATAASQYAAIATGLSLTILVVHETLGATTLTGGALLLVSLTLTLLPPLRAAKRNPTS